MKSNRRFMWSAGAKAISFVIAGLAVWMLVHSIRHVRDALQGEPLDWVFAVMLIILYPLIALGLFWISWRLWQRWSAATARTITGVVMALVAMYLLHLTFDVLYGENASARGDWAYNATATLLLIPAAVGYRKVSRAIIRWADLEDPQDAHGHPIGHMSRVQAFCAMLGISVWLSASSAAVAMRNAGIRDAALYGILGAILLGWAIYRVTLWWMTPPTRAALPPGRGFEVLPAEKKI